MLKRKIIHERKHKLFQTQWPKRHNFKPCRSWNSKFHQTENHPSERLSLGAQMTIFGFSHLHCKQCNTLQEALLARHHGNHLRRYHHHNHHDHDQNNEEEGDLADEKTTDCESAFCRISSLEPKEGNKWKLPFWWERVKGNGFQPVNHSFPLASSVHFGPKRQHCDLGQPHTFFPRTQHRRSAVNAFKLYAFKCF